MKENIECYIFTEIEIQVLISMMGKTKIYGFGQNDLKNGELLRKKTYESIYSLAKKQYIEYVDKSNKIHCPSGAYPIKFDSMCVKEEIVKLMRGIIKSKKIYDITNWDTMENVLMYVSEDKIIIVRPNLTNKEELVVCKINKDNWLEYMQDEGYLPNNSLDGKFSFTKSLSLENEKMLMINLIDNVTFEEYKTINIYKDLSYAVNDGKRILYSKKNIEKELEKR